MFEIRDLCVKVGEKEILKHFHLQMKPGETHILMGPNGAGKSTVCKSILHHPQYQILNGKIFYQDQDITSFSTDLIAQSGIYYISQTPVEIEGISNLELLRSSLVERNQKVDVFSFHKECGAICEKLGLPKSFLQREVNVGMSGGERKKNELFGMWLLKPSFLLLDEIDSGLDVDAIKLVAENLKEYQKETHASILLITHQKSLIDLLNPDFIHVMEDGHIVKSGTKDLASDIMEHGFYEFLQANNVSGSEIHE